MSEELTLAQLRDEYETLQKDHGKLKTAHENTVKENRQLKASQAFTEAGLPANLSDLFITAVPDGDISVDAVKAFAEKYGVGSSEAPAGEETESKTEETTPPATDGLKNLARVGSGSGEGGQQTAGTKTLTSREFVDQLRTDKAAAQQALAEGRVVLRDDNPMARDRVSMGTVNPFEKFNRDRLTETQTP